MGELEAPLQPARGRIPGEEGQITADGEMGMIRKRNFPSSMV